MISKAKAADKKNFGKFGSVVKLSSQAPTSSDATYKFWSNLADYKIEGKTEIGLCTVYKQAPNEISCIERHLSTPEILIPIDAPFILPLLLNEESESNLESFIVNTGEAVVINDGVWHGACLPVGKNESSYFVIFRLDTPGSDVEKKNIQPVKIEF